MEQIKCYLDKAMTGIKPFIGTILTAINYVMFPEKAYAAAAFALGIAMLMDIFSKYVAISIENGGFKKAFKDKKIFSRTLWEGTRVKLITYLSISIMVGASYRLNALPDAFSTVSRFMATVVYTVLFLREFQSMLENFRDAGADVEWLLIWSKDKENEILQKEDFEDDSEEIKVDENEEDEDFYE